MSKAGRIKQEIAAVRSLLRHLEQGQTRWLARLASPGPPLLDPAQCGGVELITALSRFDPMDGFDFYLSAPGSTLRKEPLGIGARPRNAVFPVEPGREKAAAIGPLPQRERSSAPSRTRYQKQGMPSDHPNTGNRTTRGADPCAAALLASRTTDNAHAGGDDRKTTPKVDKSVTRKSTLAALDNPVATSAAKPLTKAQQVAAARKALTRNALPVEVARNPKRDSTIPRPDQPDAPRNRSETTESGNGNHIASVLESAIRQTLHNTHHPAEPQRVNPSTRTGPTEPAAQPAAPAPAGDTGEAGLGTRTRSAVQIDDLRSQLEPASPDHAPPAPAEPPRVHDDLAEQLAEAARLHGVDLA